MMEKQENRLAVFVSSPHEYSDVFAIFLARFRAVWGDCPYPLVLSTDRGEYDGVNVIKNPPENDGWVKRAVFALRQMDYKYILLLCDDLILEEKPDEAGLEAILDCMDQRELVFCRLKPYSKGNPVEENENLLWVRKRMAYGLNLQKGIYRVDWLLEKIGNTEKSAWDYEKEWNAEAYKAKDEDFENVVVCKRELVKTVHGVVKGKWLPTAVKRIRKMGLRVEGERGTMSCASELLLNCKGSVGALLSPEMRYKAKRLLRKIGFHFVTDN